ncbi:hypothetical protein [Roseobacter weihaiensis]|uniref:hypothetical protein n=1 Tax=Roseobacter weihaiensis TaxID=2763262 RepID=UPI001D0A3A42|nr:hypothetical protein [Roseobacter sp. H9]
MMDVNATQLAGVLSFGIAAIACYSAWRRGAAAARLWGWISAIYVLMAADVLWGGRYMLSDAVRGGLRALEAYDDRRLWQSGLVVALLLVAALVLWRARAGLGPRAVWLSLLAPVFFLLEATSLHAIDAVFYHRVGPLLGIGWLWVGLAVLTTVCARRAVRTRRP